MSESGCVLVTGGSRGLGLEIVRRLAESGTAVAMTWRSDESRVHELVDSIHGTVSPYRLDLADKKRPKELVNEIEEELGPIEGLVNNAGMQSSQLLAMTSDSSWEEVLDINLGGTFRCCRAVIPGMVRRRRGSIVNIASLGALRGVAGQSAYAASKAGVLALTRCLAREVGRRQIRVNAVVPGFIATDMTENLSPEAVATLRTSEALPNGVAAESVADTVLFLLSDGAASITGQSLCVDAGASV